MATTAIRYATIRLSGGDDLAVVHEARGGIMIKTPRCPGYILRLVSDTCYFASPISDGHPQSDFL